jgi:hypothetical protein
MDSPYEWRVQSSKFRASEEKQRVISRLAKPAGGRAIQM